jgi:hypothetical protein
MKKVLILAAMFLLVIPNCSKKTTTNNHYYDGPEEAGALVGVVHPPESQAQVTAYMGIPVASTQIDSVGYFSLSGLPAGDYTLLVQADGYRDCVPEFKIRLREGSTTVLDTVFLASVHELVSSVWPLDGAQNVKLSESITIRFYEPMNQTSVEAAFQVDPPIEGAFNWSPPWPSAYLGFTPKPQLAADRRYQVIIDTTASDTAGVKLAQPYRFAFTTEPITIRYTGPANNATEVSPLAIVLVAFNTDMDAASVVSAFKMVDSNLEEVSGAFFWHDQQRVEFRPNSALLAGEKYTVTIDMTASDLHGTKLPQPYHFSFTTEFVNILYTNPRQGDTEVSPLAKIRISFGTEMDVESVNLAFSMIDSEWNHVTGEFRWYGLQTMEFSPVSPLAVNETYTVTVDTNASGVGGSKLPDPYQFSFTTAPIRVSSSPGINETGVSPHNAIKISFNTNMETESVDSAFKMVDSELQDVTGDIVWLSQHQMEFRPSSALALKEEYTVTIDTIASDIYGERLSEPYQFSFTTESLKISSNPGDNDAWVSPKTEIRIWFNADMEIESVNSAFRMVDSEESQVTGNFEWLRPSALDFQPHLALAVSERYTVTIDTSACTAWGAKVPVPHQFSFTTQPIIVVSTSPKLAQTWVPAYIPVRIAFNTDMDAESLISAFTMVDSELNEVTGEFSSPSFASVQFDPDPDLAPGEVYTVTISAAAADTYGSTLGTPYSFWFKTQP